MSTSDGPSKMANPLATKQFIESKEFSLGSRVLGRTGLAVSPVGFGSYRVDDRVSTHQDALHQALNQGCNLIDTSSNYGDGHSEVLIGKVLAQRASQSSDTRGQWVIVTKAGYLQGQALIEARKRERDKQAYPDVVKCDDQLWHCISPDLLRDHLTRSLERLRLSAVDVFLLHNPEYYFQTSSDRAEYDRRLQQAFAYLEEEVAAGRIGAYGISSNTFVSAPNDPKHTSLETLWNLAEGVSAAHHFSVVQAPLNLFESGGILEGQTNGRTFYDQAQDYGLGVLWNRPLNAFVHNKLIRLVSYAAESQSEAHFDESVKQALEGVLACERSLPPVGDLSVFRLGHELAPYIDELTDLPQWNDMMTYHLGPSLRQTFSELASVPDIRTWRETYLQKAWGLIEALTARATSRSAQLSKDIQDVLKPYLAEVPHGLTLSQMCLSLYAHACPESVTLVGMRDSAYVQDVFAASRLNWVRSGRDILKDVDALINKKGV